MAAKRISPGRFTWLASDGWGKQSAVVNGIEDFAIGAITVELESKKIHGRNERTTERTNEAVGRLLACSLCSVTPVSVSASQSAIKNGDNR